MLIYTVIFDGPEQYDSLPRVDPDKAHFVAFMDISEPYMDGGWECRPAVYHDFDARKRARHHKVMSCELFPGEPYTLWVDGNVTIGDDIDQFMKYQSDIVAMPHHQKADNTWIDEAERCMGNERVMKHVSLNALKRQVDKYTNRGLSKDAIAPETRVLFRRNNERTRRFEETWWHELNTQTIRDQVSFAWAREKSGASLDLLPRHIFQKPIEGQFTAHPHHPKIYFFNPFDRRGLGWAYNNYAEIVPSSEAWICFMDFDVMLFPSSIPMLIEDVVMRLGNYFDYFTCLTNRVLAHHMCVDGNISGERDLVKLYQLAMRRLEEHGDHVSQWTESFAGYFMLFKKSLWEEIPFPLIVTARKGSNEHEQCRVLGIDTEWHRRLEAAGKKMGCIDGLTAIHYYRMAEEHAEHREMLENPEAVKPRLAQGLKPVAKPVQAVAQQPVRISHRIRKGRS
jgi:hypothetical protein